MPTTTSDKTYSVEEISQLLAHYFLAKKTVPEDDYENVISKYISKGKKDSNLSPSFILCKTNELLHEIGFQAQRYASLNNKYFYVCYSTLEDSLIKDKSFNWHTKDSKFFWQIVRTLFENLTKNAFKFDPDDDDSLIDLFTMERKQAEKLKQHDLTHLMSESLIAKWIEEDYFQSVNSTAITLGVRTLAEMSKILTESFNLMNCKDCKLICFVGYRCESCDVIYHNKCCEIVKCNECNNDMGALRLFI